VLSPVFGYRHTVAIPVDPVREGWARIQVFVCRPCEEAAPSGLAISNTSGIYGRRDEPAISNLFPSFIQPLYCPSQCSGVVGSPLSGLRIAVYDLSFVPWKRS